MFSAYQSNPFSLFYTPFVYDPCKFQDRKKIKSIFNKIKHSPGYTASLFYSLPALESEGKVRTIDCTSADSEGGFIPNEMVNLWEEIEFSDVKRIREYVIGLAMYEYDQGNPLMAQALYVDFHGFAQNFSQGECFYPEAAWKIQQATEKLIKAYIIHKPYLSKDDNDHNMRKIGHDISQANQRILDMSFKGMDEPMDSIIHEAYIENYDLLKRQISAIEKGKYFAELRYSGLMDMSSEAKLTMLWENISKTYSMFLKVCELIANEELLRQSNLSYFKKGFEYKTNSYRFAIDDVGQVLFGQTFELEGLY